VIAEARLPRIWRRPDAMRGGPHSGQRGRLPSTRDIPATSHLAALDAAEAHTRWLTDSTASA